MPAPSLLRLTSSSRSMRLRTLRPMERILRLDMPPRGISRSMEFVERDSCLWKKRVRWEEGGSGVRKGCMEGEETHLRSTLQPYAVRAVRTTTPFCSLLTLSGSERRREKSRRRPFHEQSGQRRRARRRPPRGPLGRRHGARVRTVSPTLSAAPSRAADRTRPAPHACTPARSPPSAQPSFPHRPMLALPPPRGTPPLSGLSPTRHSTREARGCASSGAPLYGMPRPPSPLSSSLLPS